MTPAIGCTRSTVSIPVIARSRIGTAGKQVFAQHVFLIHDGITFDRLYCSGQGRFLSALYIDTPEDPSLVAMAACC
jgi:hypothetical protein